MTPVPNCTTTGLAMTLKPLHDAFGVAQVIMTSMQACSGAGRSPGVIGLDIIDNVVPYIPKEEEKVEKETQKILGSIVGETVVPAAFPVSGDLHQGSCSGSPHRGGLRFIEKKGGSGRS